MVDSDTITADTSPGGIVDKHKDTNTGIEAVAPWQEKEEEQRAKPASDRIDEQEPQQHESKAKVDKAEEVQQQEQQASEDQRGTDDDTSMGVVDPLAGLGSVDDIAAAAMQAAGLAAIFGEATEADRGTKRSHDEMTEAQTEAAVMAQFSTVAPNPSEITTSVEKEQPLPAVASFQNSFAQFQAEPESASASITAPALQDAKTTSIPTIIDAGAETKDGLDTEQKPDITTNPTETEAVSAPSEGEAMAGLSMMELGDLEAVAQAAMGLDANGNPLPGNEESHRALAEAVKRLSAVQGITTSNQQSTSSNNNGGGGEEDDRSKSQDGGPVKRFQCTKCERAFARAYNLNTHLATHDPDPSRSKPFPCPYPSCKTDGGRSFSRKHDLQRHVASTHEDEPEPGINGTDENGSRQTGGLASLGLGTPGRKFRCQDCGRAFVRRDALKRHQCTRVMEATSDFQKRLEGTDYYSNSAAGLSLYTSNATPTQRPPPLPAQQPQQPIQSGAAAAAATSLAGSSYDSDPFGPNGITYENLSKEVQDMAMQLVAQAQSYNEQKGKSTQAESSTSNEVQPAGPQSIPTTQHSQPADTPAPIEQPQKQPPDSEASTKSTHSVPLQIQQASNSAPAKEIKTETSSGVSMPVGTAAASLSAVKAEEDQPLPSSPTYPNNTTTTTSASTPSLVSAK